MGERTISVWSVLGKALSKSPKPRPAAGEAPTLGPEEAAASSFAALAAKQGHDALLVDVLPGPEGALREGFWLHPGGEADARLIAHVVVRDAEAGYVGPPTFPDVWDRLATAHCRLPAPRR